MKRNVSLEEISDGRLYSIHDMVKADCHGCKGCFACCCGMGNSVILDPFDVYRLQTGLGKNLTQLLQEDKLELNVVEGLILPNMKTNGESERCGFLNQEGRCSIHALRPGFCRIFPLGRYYENGSFQYFLQIHECKKEPKTKVKVQKWIDTPDIKRNEKFIIDWHYFLKEWTNRLSEAEDSYRKTVCLYLLKTFYQKPYEVEKDFYVQFYERLEEARMVL